MIIVVKINYFLNEVDVKSTKFGKKKYVIEETYKISCFGGYVISMSFFLKKKISMSYIWQFILFFFIEKGRKPKEKITRK
jgi:hypothetical protein